MSAVYEIMNINIELRIFVNASHSLFLKKHENIHKIKTKTFLKNSRRTFVENAMILTSAKIQTKILMFGNFGAPESFLGGL